MIPTLYLNTDGRKTQLKVRDNLIRIKKGRSYPTVCCLQEIFFKYEHIERVKRK
jgi:hypothetical protein